jgi:hypothetical protein
MGEQDRRPIWLAPVTSNDGSPRASMTTVVLSPLRKQGDVSKIPAAPTAVLPQSSSAPPTATIPHTQGSSTSSIATLACTRGSCTSPPDTLAHSYTPIVHLDPLLASIKGRSRAFMREGRAGERADEQAHSLSLSRTLVTPTTSASPWRRITRAAFSPLCSISCQPIWAGTTVARQEVAFGFVPPPSSPQEEEAGQLWPGRRRHLVGCRASRRHQHPSGGHVGRCPRA